MNTEMNNNKTQISKEKFTEAQWKLFQLDSNRARVANYGSGYKGKSSCFTVRNDERYQITQESAVSDIVVEKYESKFH